MPERVNRRTFLILTALAPTVVLAACKGSADKKPESLLEGATQADFESTFDQIFAQAYQDKNVATSTRSGGPQDGITEINFDGGNFKGTLSLEKGYRPGNLLGFYIKDDSAKSIDLITPGAEGKPTTRFLVASWSGQEALSFLPPEKYTNPSQGIVEPHKMTPKELGVFLANVWASFNAVRLPPLNQ
jgi:hypothetical protein